MPRAWTRFSDKEQRAFQWVGGVDMDAYDVPYRTLLRLSRNGYFSTDDEKVAFQFTEKGKAVWDSIPEDAKSIANCDECGFDAVPYAEAETIPF